MPPLALLTGLSIALICAAGVAAALGAPSWTMLVASLALALIAIAVAIAWLRYGRRQVPFRYLLAAPLYLLWKLPLYLSFALGRRERQWRRTER